MMPAKAAAMELTARSPPVTPPMRAGAAAAGKMPYHRLPKPAPSGKETTAACWASAAARTGPRVMTPGVACFTAIAPAPTVIRAVVISAAAARVPV